MIGAQFDTACFILVPLTPLHIGGGEEAILTPEDFRLTESHLERVDLRKVLLRQDAVRLVSAAGRDLLGTLARARDQAREEDVEERIAISSAARDYLCGAFVMPKSPQERRQGKVNAFQRSGGKPVLPGSSLKGALRTAWLARWSKGVPEDTGRTNVRHRRLTESAFALRSGKQATDTDPMRDVTVSDAALPENATLIDKLESWKRTAGHYGFATDGKANFVMHWERTRSVVDGGKPPPLIELSIGLRALDIVAQRSSKKRDHVPSRAPLAPAALLAALNAHHEPLWTRELEKYFPGAEGQRLRKALCLFNHLRRATDPKADPDAALIRIGRGGHAESKSVATHREVQRPQATGAGKRAKEGSTRHVVRLCDDSPAPFGWALLVRKDRWKEPGQWLPPPECKAGASQPARPSAGTSPASTPPPRAATPIWHKGQKVLLNDGETAELLEDVWENSGEVQVRIGGDTEWVDPADITGPAR